jgi:tRNA U34 5-carboxymethylaminomethyl modifying enzyme MnmG/GidA
MAFLASADEVRSKISNLRTQQDVGLLNAEMARKEKNYQNKAEQYYGLLEQGRISIQEYEDGLRAERYNAFQATASTLTQIASRDNAEIQNLTQLADVIYAQINAQNVKDQGAYQAWIDRANQGVAPIKNLLDAILTQDTLVTSQEAA